MMAAWIMSTALDVSGVIDSTGYTLEVNVKYESINFGFKLF